MTALLVLLLAAASVVAGSDWVGRRSSRMAVGVRLLLGMATASMAARRALSLCMMFFLEVCVDWGNRLPENGKCRFR